MEDIFQTSNTQNLGVLTQNIWNNSKKVLQTNLSRYIQYYRHAAHAVPSDHFLVSLIRQFNVTHAVEDYRFYTLMQIDAMGIAAALKMTSSVVVGQMRDGVFLGPGNAEVIIGHADVFNPTQAALAWEDLRPVEFLRHPRSDLTMAYPNGSNTGSESGLVVVAVNIPMLAIQYRAWLQREVTLSETLGMPQRTLMHFVHQYPLTNAMHSYQDLAVINRIECLKAKRPTGISIYRHSFAINRPEVLVDQALAQMLVAIGNGNMKFQIVMRNVLLISLKNMHQVMCVPVVLETYQVTWAFTVARIRHCMLLMRLARDGAWTANSMEMNALIRLLKAYASNSRLQTAMSVDGYVLMQNDLKELEMLMKK